MSRLPRLVRVTVRTYRFLLKAYPRSFRDEFGDEMVQVFREIAADALRQRGYPGLLLTCCRIAADLAGTIVEQHVAQLTGGIAMSNLRRLLPPAVAGLMLLSIWIGQLLYASPSRHDWLHHTTNVAGILAGILHSRGRGKRCLVEAMAGAAMGSAIVLAFGPGYQLRYLFDYGWEDGIHTLWESISTTASFTILRALTVGLVLGTVARCIIEGVGPSGRFASLGAADTNTSGTSN